LEHGMRYHWRVNAAGLGGTSQYSAVWNFTTVVAVPAVPILADPLNGATDIGINPRITWHHSAGANSYRVQRSIDSGFGSLIKDTSIADTSILANGLENGLKYYWRVNASNPGGTSIYSAVWHFTTIVAQPGPPTLLLPLNGSTGNSINPTLTWSSAN